MYNNLELINIANVYGFKKRRITMSNVYGFKKRRITMSKELNPIESELFDNGYRYFGWSTIEHHGLCVYGGHLWVSEVAVFTLQILEDQKLINLAKVSAIPKRQGNGTKAMRVLCNAADKHHYDIVLQASSKFGTPVKILKKWYKELGFKRFNNNNILKRSTEKENNNESKT